ncbi:DNA polymerase III, gamma/tau subunits [Microbacterium testaceum StLB037]|uniref:DNA-directed DNA polymerase n=1 Tax=Microbacterium testaceum (strain StLB037) TaxID=979556 RepID=E8N7X2_MICTS|nr:DNA polymerase III subunit gamma and tau [Microbacterium testaceum]BAJ75592.1 DNA polymerase III, gamma/tau subunits [Microbacterium testaceum StLB037]
MTTALYRRYRPQAFGEMIGQSQVTEPLMTALRSDRVGHAYLFSGPRGCGKTTSARILARCLNCAAGPTDTPCGTCDSCVELGRGGSGSLDVVEIDAASHNGVDDARDLRERAIFAPARDRFKIFILDEAHMVTQQGFNALLKLVEEPPAHVKFIFATTEPEKVLGTIRSRTHHYPFRLVPPAAMLEYVQELCESENVSVEAGVLPLVVRAGGGSPRDTLSLLDQLIAGSDPSTGSDTEQAGHVLVRYERAVALLGYTHSELLDEVVDAFAANDGGGAFAAVDRVVQTGQDPRRFVDDLLERLRDLIVVAATGAGASAVLRGVPDDELERMARQATAFGVARLSRTADLVVAALDEMTGATSPRLQLELLVARVLTHASVSQGSSPATIHDLDAARTAAPAAAPATGRPASPAADIAPAGGNAARVAAPSAPRIASPGAGSAGATAAPAVASPAVAAPGTASPAVAAPGVAAPGRQASASPVAPPASPTVASPTVASPRVASPNVASPVAAPTAAPASPAVASPAVAAPTTGEGRAAPAAERPAPPTGAQPTGAQPTGAQPRSDSPAPADDDAPPPFTDDDAPPPDDEPGPDDRAPEPRAPEPQAATSSTPRDSHGDADAHPFDTAPTPDGPAPKGEKPREDTPPAPAPSVEPAPAEASTDAAAEDPSPLEPVAPTPPATPVGPIELGHVRDAWPEILGQLEVASRSSWLIVSTSTVAAFDDDVLTLLFRTASDLTAFKTRSADGGPSEDLRQAILAVLGVRVKYLARLDGDGPGGPGASGPGGPRGNGSGSPAAPPRGGASAPRASAPYSASVTEWAVAPIPGAAPGATAPATALAVDDEPEEARPAAAAAPVAREGAVLPPAEVSRSVPAPEEVDDDDVIPPADEAPDAPVPPVIVPRMPPLRGGVQRYGEAVVRQMLGATYLRDEPYEPPTRFT